MLRDVAGEQTAAIVVDSPTNSPGCRSSRASTCRCSNGCARYTGDRPLFDLHGGRERDRACAGAARRPEVGRLPDHRPDRGADHDRRQHRRLHRRAQLRRHHLQDQPRGRARPSRASCACATWAASSSSTSSTWAARAPRRGAAELRRALARDRTRTSVNGFTALGLVELTRKRTRESLAHVLCEPCATCGGRGEPSRPRARSATRSCARSSARRASSIRRNSASSPRKA
jgi:ribonuclease G